MQFGLAVSEIGESICGRKTDMALVRPCLTVARHIDTVKGWEGGKHEEERGGETWVKEKKLEREVKDKRGFV